ncbi:glucokinase [Haladaptatus litoreus]|uniref:Glucokinase n=1 Tax=Haladaptatus litoreus TaxID=553468 RepID=A0A1N7DJV8_9EURY|nr:ROK family protein [Haladaptatus litoreus]SIR76035.1 glucokinase [Haladaptatus litoreus]
MTESRMGLQEKVLAIDIGSTRLQAVIGTQDGEFITEVNCQSTKADRLLDQIDEIVQWAQSFDKFDIRYVSISSTGLIDKEEGVITSFDSSDASEYTNIRIVDEIESKYNIRTLLENDCNSAVLGEWVFGERNGYNTVAHVSISTGIGGGVIQNGNLLTGENGQSSEIGLFTVDYSSEHRSCGVRGAWEAYCSGRGIPSFVIQKLAEEARDSSLYSYTDLSAKDLFYEAAQGDNVARDYLDRIGRYNAAGMGNLINAYNPGLVTLSGSVVLNNQESILNPLYKYLDSYVYVQEPIIKVSSMGEYIGLYGSLALSRTSV